MPTEYTFLAEYAKSGRATCKGCNRSIAKSVLRIGVKQSSTNDENDEPNPAREAPKWYHAECKCVGQFRKTAAWWEQNCPDVEDIEGFDELKDEDRDDLETLVEALREGKGVAPKKKPVKKPKEESEGDSEESEEEKPKKKKKSPTSSSSSKSKHESEDDSDSSDGSGDDSDSESEEEAPKKSKKKVTKKRKRDEESESDEDSDSDEDAKRKSKKAKKPAPKKKAGGKKAAVEYTAKVLDDEKVEKINDVIQTIASKTLPQLKAMLTKNEVKTSGTKAELLERIGEATVLGCIPKCEECGGNLRWNKEDGVYTCPGKFEDGHMKRCTFKSESVERTPWRS